MSGGIWLRRSLTLAWVCWAAGCAEPSAALPAVRLAQPVARRPQLKLHSATPEDAAQFGSAVALAGDTLLVGAFLETVSDSQKGAAHLFERSSDGWREQRVFAASASSADSRFGSALALTETEALVGVGWDPTDAGSVPGTVYVFSTREAAEPERLVSAALDGHFGARLAVREDTLLVGAPDEDGGSGAAYLYRRDPQGWQLEQRITSKPENDHRHIARELAVGSDIAALVADSSDDYQVVVFERNGETWSEVKTLAAPSPSGLWGASVALHERFVFVGDPDGGQRGFGAVHVFEREKGYERVATLASAVPSPGFGSSLALDGDRLVVGCRDAAIVFALEQGQWSEVEALLPADVNPIGGFAAVAISAERVALAAPHASAVNLEEPGAVFLFEGCDADTDCPEQSFCRADGSCDDLKRTGAACERAGECRSGYCVDELCCNTACQGSCEACAEPEQQGTCVPVEGTPRGERAACAEHEICGGACNGVSRACSYAPPKTPCGTRCTAEGAALASCDGAGACDEEPPHSCGDYACSDGGCREYCEDDRDCVGDASCVSRSCAVQTAAACSEDGSESIGPLGARACGAYRCNRADGACLSACASSSQCATGYVCDDATRNCIAEVPAASGCSCHFAGRPSAAEGLLSLAALALFRQRRGRRARVGAGALLAALLNLSCGARQRETAEPLARTRTGLSYDVIWTQGETLTGQPGFGVSLAISGDTLLVGGPHAAEIFTRQADGWLRVQILEPGAQDGSCFAESIALDGDTALVGALNGARLLQRAKSGEPFTDMGRLEVEGTAATEQMGCVVALHGDLAMLSDGLVSVAFIRAPEGWQQGGVLTGVVRALGNELVALQRQAANGSRSEIELRRSRGADYELTATLSEAPNPARDDFGMSVVLNDDSVVVGDYGIAYAYDAAKLEAEPQLLTPPNGGTRAQFGTALALFGDVLLIGDPVDLRVEGPAAHVFRGARSSWQHTFTVLGPAQLNSTSGHYARALAVGERELLVGADDLALGTHGPFGAVATYGPCSSDTVCGGRGVGFCGSDGFCHPIRDLGESCDVAAGRDCLDEDCPVCGLFACVDGVCCDSACTGQCEACNEPGKLGECVQVSGEPRSGRPACAAGQPACAGVCAGDSSSCTYPGSSKTCGNSCSEGRETPRACDGRGACVARRARACAGYACGEQACLSSCASDGDCSTGFECNDAECIALTRARECSDDGASSHGADGERSCGDYSCDPTSGECRSECTATRDCAAGLVCDVERKACVTVEIEPAGEAGCGCRAASGGARGLYWLLGAAVLISRARRSSALARRTLERP